MDSDVYLNLFAQIGSNFMVTADGVGQFARLHDALQLRAGIHVQGRDEDQCGFHVVDQLRVRAGVFQHALRAGRCGDDVHVERDAGFVQARVQVGAADAY